MRLLQKIAFFSGRRKVQKYKKLHVTAPIETKQKKKNIICVVLFKKSVFLRPENRTGCGAVGSALRSGRRGRKFESSHPDNTVETQSIASLLLFKKLYLCAQILRK